MKHMNRLDALKRCKTFCTLTFPSLVTFVKVFRLWDEQLDVLQKFFLLMKVIEESEKVGLKLNIQNTKIMASGPITSWQRDGETVQTVTDYFGGSKITSDGECSHEVKRHLLLGRSYDRSRWHIKKQRHYFVNRGLSSQGYDFYRSHVWM